MMVLNVFSFGSRNSEIWKSTPDKFFPNFVGITKDGAEWLVKKM